MASITIETNRAAGLLPVRAPDSSNQANKGTWGSRIVEQLTPRRETYMKWANVAAHVAAIFAQVAVYLLLVAPLIIGIVTITHINPLLLCLAATVSGTSSIMITHLNKSIFDELHKSIDRNIK
jgi:hypothetical protein